MGTTDMAPTSGVLLTSVFLSWRATAAGYDDPWHKAHDAFRADMADLAAAFHACVAQVPFPAHML